MTTLPMTTWVHDGFTFDLTHAWIDCFGNRWEWTGETDAAGPLMLAVTEHPDCKRSPLPLAEVYATFGPLIPAPRDVTHAERLAALTACARQEPKPVAIEEPKLTGAAPCLVPLTGPKPAPAPVPTPSLLAVLLKRLRGHR